MNIPEVLATAFFYRTTLVAAFELSFSIRKNFLKRKLVKRLPLNELACFLYKYKSLQVCQQPGEHLSFSQNFLNFIVTKYLKAEDNDNVSLCMVERSPCGPSITGDIKIYQCHVTKT